MKFEELLEKTKGLDLDSMGVYVSIGKPANRVESISLFKDGDQWVIQKVDDRQRVFEKRGSEDKIVSLMNGYIELLG